MNDSTTFDPKAYLRKLGKGGDYLEVKWRLLWVRTAHPEAHIETELVRLDGDFALFRASVSIPGGGGATGYGSETKGDFGDYIEKAETKAIGRALAALGFGTQFCEDHDMLNPDGSPHPVDSPVELPAGNGRSGPTQDTNSRGNGMLSSPAQVKLIYMVGTRNAGLTEEQLDSRCEQRYGRLPLHLTKREASEFIDTLKGLQVIRGN